MKTPTFAPESTSKHLWNPLVSLVFAPPALQSTIFSQNGTILGEITIFHQHLVEFRSFHLKSRLRGVKSHNPGRPAKRTRKSLPTQGFEGIGFYDFSLFLWKTCWKHVILWEIHVSQWFSCGFHHFHQNGARKPIKSMQIAVSFAPCPPKSHFHLKRC